MHSEARLLMHRDKGASSFRIVNSALDRSVFSHIDSNNVMFRDGYSTAHPKEIYLSSISIIPIGFEKLFSEVDTRPSLPPGVRHLDLDDDVEDPPKTTKLSILQYYQDIKQALIVIEDRNSGNRLLWSNLLLFLPNHGTSIQLDRNNSLLEHIMLLNIANGWILNSNSVRYKAIGEINIIIDNNLLPEIDLDFVVTLGFEVEPFDQPMFGTWTPVNPSPQVLPWITTAPNTGTSTVYTVPPGREFRIDNVAISALNGTNRVYINGVEVPPSGSTPS